MTNLNERPADLPAPSRTSKAYGENASAIFAMAERVTAADWVQDALTAKVDHVSEARRARVLMAEALQILGEMSIDEAKSHGATL